MDFFRSHLLSFILFTPAAGALLLALLPVRRERLLRGVAVGISLLPLAFTILLWAGYNTAAAGFQFEERSVWYEAVGSAYHLGVDGVSLPLIALTALLFPLALLVSAGIKERLRAYLALFLLLETGILGVFLSLDLLLFFLFWEAGLIPMYFLIQQWGSANRDYAANKFLLFTMGGSLGLLLAIQAMRLAVGSFDLADLYFAWPSLSGMPLGIPAETLRALAFWAFVIAFAIKIPIWPFHTWLPDAHTEAPTAGSMILAGVMLKLGGYGFLRLVLPLFPAESTAFAPVLAVLAALSIVFGAMAAWAQQDFKRLVAYSSVSHMGFVVLGIAAAAASPVRELALGAWEGASLQMVNHGLSAAGMFLLVGALYERTHTRNLDEFGGLFRSAPVYGGILIFTAMGSLGLPGLGGFVSELLVVMDAFPVFPGLVGVAVVGLLLTGAYIFKVLGKVLHGPFNERWRGIPIEIGAREVIAMAPLMLLMLLIGLWPAPLLALIGSAFH